MDEIFSTTKFRGQFDFFFNFSMKIEYERGKRRKNKSLHVPYRSL